MEILKKTNIDFMGKRNYAFAASAVLCLFGIICVVMMATGKANMGIDFAGGASADMIFAKPLNMADARGALDKAGFGDAEIQALSGEGSKFKLLVRVKKTNVPTEQVVGKLKEAFDKSFPDNPAVIDSSSAIGPTVGKALQKDALWAIIISFIGIIVYIAIRFEFRFGIAATIATFHDVLAVLGVFMLLHKEITLLVVTAVLTLAGYSLTDTVVVFDRIRENLKLRQKDGLLDIINSSINEVLSRTIVTSMTAFLTVLALFFFGGEVLHDFAFAMIFGIIVGTYSSIFVASPVLYVWKGTKGGRLIKAAMLTKQPVKDLSAKPAPVSVKPVQPAPEAKPVAVAPAPDGGAGKGKKGKGGRKKSGARA